MRSRPVLDRPGLLGTARVDRRTDQLLPRLRAGDVAVIDHVDLDRATAQALVDAGVVAVVNAAPMVSGRYPNLGPEVLLGAGVTVVDRVPDALEAIGDGRRVRLHEGEVHVGEEQVAEGRELDAATLTAELDAARRGLTTQLETFTHTTAEVLRREQDVLLHGQGLPALTTKVPGRPVVVAAEGPELEADLQGLRTYLREQHPVLVAVGRAADLVREAGLRPEVVVVVAGDGELPSARTLRGARDVVLHTDRGVGSAAADQLERLGVRPQRLETSAAPEDAAVVLAVAADPTLVVTAGRRVTLEDLLDRQRGGVASTYLARLKAGPLLVDAPAVPRLYAGRVRPRHLLLVMLAGLLALAAAVGVTPVGQEWADSLGPALSDVADTLQGLLP